MKYKWLPVIDFNHCSGCRACTLFCISGSLRFQKGQVVFKNPDGCLSDGFCVRECPIGTIHMQWVPGSYRHHGIVVEQKEESSGSSEYFAFS